MFPLKSDSVTKKFLESVRLIYYRIFGLYVEFRHLVAEYFGFWSPFKQLRHFAKGGPFLLGKTIHPLDYRSRVHGRW